MTPALDVATAVLYFGFPKKDKSSDPASARDAIALIGVVREPSIAEAAVILASSVSVRVKDMS